MRARPAPPAAESSGSDSSDLESAQRAFLPPTPAATSRGNDPESGGESDAESEAMESVEEALAGRSSTEDANTSLESEGELMSLEEELRTTREQRRRLETKGRGELASEVKTEVKSSKTKEEPKTKKVKRDAIRRTVIKEKQIKVEVVETSVESEEEQCYVIKSSDEKPETDKAKLAIEVEVKEEYIDHDTESWEGKREVCETVKAKLSSELEENTIKSENAWIGFYRGGVKGVKVVEESISDSEEETPRGAGREQGRPAGLGRGRQVARRAPSPPCCAPAPRLAPTLPRALQPYTLVTEGLAVGSVWDSHCHLDFLASKLAHAGTRRGEELEVALALDAAPLGAAFGGCVANFCDPAGWRCGAGGRHVSPVLRSCMAQPRVHLALGCHPHFADKLGRREVERLEVLLLARRGGVVAVGECGLDTSNKNSVPMRRQVEAFRAQVELALRLRLPLVLHIRGAEEEGRRVLSGAGVPPSWPIHRHCWNDTWEAAESWLQLFPGSKLGVTGLVTSPRNRALHEVVRRLPLSHLLLETDAPYHLPALAKTGAYRHAFSHPGHVLHVAAQVIGYSLVGLNMMLYLLYS